ncbi:MAG: hypothetical protein LiPW15_40 [Parcubacteria group bacterium LiPW_15]|nr:MAG: hypothetical protein LiPW15_40 [Parcubacteria group bacterium LiPW_15]
MRLVRILPLLLGTTLLAESPKPQGSLTTWEKIAKAKEVLRIEEPKPIYASRKGKATLVGKESLRALERPDGTFHVVRIRLLFVRRGKNIDTAVQSVYPEFCAAERINGGGVNASYRVLCDGVEETVFAGKDLNSRGKEITGPDGKPECYVPYSDALATPEVVEAGRAYLKKQISLAANELRAQRVHSRGIPGKLVADVFQEKMLYDLAVIEHVDHKEFYDESTGKLPENYTQEKVLAQLSLNGPEAFFYSKSKIRGTTAGALCLMQIMPSTYNDRKEKRTGKIRKGIRSSYPEARLPLSAQEGSCGSHASAIKTAYLVLDSKLSAMQPEFKRLFAEDPETYGVYLAVAYNGGEVRARNLFAKTRNPAFKLKEILNDLFRTLGLKKERQKLSVLRQETWIYIKKYFELSNIPDANGE